MNRILLIGVLLLQGACVGGSMNAPPIAIYDFGQPAERLAAAGQWTRLALDVRAPPWLDAPNIDYRLTYEDPLKQREYTGSRWAGTPASLLAQRLRQQLGVTSGSANTAAECLLRVELQEFSQIFDSVHKSRGVVHGVVMLIDGRRQVIGERSLRVEKPAPTLDAPGGVSALVSASDGFGGELASWLSALGETSRAKSCLRAN